VLFFSEGFSGGVCAAGGTHQAQGFEFQLPFNGEETKTTQTNWRLCLKCHAMFYNVPNKHGCPAGGAHAADSKYPYSLAHDVRETARAQSAWRFCNKCNAMFYDGFADKGHCAAGGAHVAQGFNFVLEHGSAVTEPPPPPPAPTRPIRILGKRPLPPPPPAKAPTAPPTQTANEWLTSADYQREFDAKKSQFYPANIEGRCHNGREEFRAVWKVRPAESAFESYHVLTKQQFEDKKNTLREQGYSLESSAVFQDCNNVTKYQATWLRK